MTFLTHRPMMLEITNLSHESPPVSLLDRATVAEAIVGRGWSVEYHEAPDYETCLIVLPETDEGSPTFVISAAGSRFCLQGCRDDALHHLGEFRTLSETIKALRRALSGQTAQRSGVDTRYA